MRIVKELMSTWFLSENVPTINNTVIRDEIDRYINIISYIQEQLGSEYVGRAEVVNCADYGMPQMRKRLITIFTKDLNAKNIFKNMALFYQNLLIQNRAWTERKNVLP